jgi:hypothetical protein
MKLNWLASTAIALVIGSGAVIAQSQPDQKKQEGPRAESPPSSSKAAEQPADRQKEPRGGAPERKQAQEPGGDSKQPSAQDRPGRGEAERKQAQEPARDGKQPSAQDRPGRGEAESKQAQEPARDSKQPSAKDQPGRGEAERKQAQEPAQPARDGKQPSQAQQERDRRPGATQQGQDQQKSGDARQPADPKQQQGQPQQPAPATQQGARPGDRPQGEASRPSDRTTTRETSISEQQRSDIVNRLRRERMDRSRNINIEVNIGQRLPPRVQPRRLPPDIVRIAPQYRDYHYTVIEDEVVIVHPRTREVVEIIREPGAATRSTVREQRVVLTREQRDTIKQSARRMTSAPTSSGSATSGTLSDTSCLTLQQVPEDLVRANSELGNYRMLAVGEQIVLIDPREQKVVEVFD